jgi:RecA/RadA recombinase
VAGIFAFFLLPWLIPLALGRLHHHPNVAFVAIVAAFSVGLPAIWVASVTYVLAQREADKAKVPGLAEIADGLANRIRSQWEDEVEARRLNVPYPLPVAWAAADASLWGDLSTLERLAINGAGYSEPDREKWAKRPKALSGGKGKLADVLVMVPTGRLVVLGEPGSGKTMLMVRLVLDLLHPGRRGSGGPVPVLASLASWDPRSRDLHSWLGDTLITDYPDLAAAPPPGSAGNNRFEALVEAGLILPVLDGLDEVPDSARPRAITRINEELRADEQVVVTCRTGQYRAAVSPQDGPGAVLRAAAVELSTLNFGEVANYLRTDAGPAAKGRWDFLDALSARSPARQALATPLMAGLARVIYNTRPDERVRGLRHPAELCDFADRAAVEAHMFTAFIPAAYRSPAGGRWTAMQAEMWLEFLARHLEKTIHSPDLAWWQLRQAAPRTAFKFLGELKPARGMRITARGLMGGLVNGLVVGLVGGLAVGLTGAPGTGFALGIAAALITVFFYEYLLGGLVDVPRDLERVTSPGAVLARDRQMALLFTLVFGLGGGLVVGLAFALATAPGAGLFLGLLVAVLGAPQLIMYRTAWPSYVLTRGWLALRHRLPWRLMSFLADAHKRGVLRQAGAVYQFRHIELQHQLATRGTRSGLDSL